MKQYRGMKNNDWKISDKAFAGGGAGTIHDSDDEDWYKFTLNESGNVSITFEHESLNSGANYWKLIFYKDEGNYKKTELDAWLIYGNDIENTTCNYGLPEGSYYIVITDWAETSTVDYTLTVDFSENKYWETEFNDTIYEADEIGVNTAYAGTIHDSDDEDWYKFTLNESGNVSITFEHESLNSTANYWKLILYKDEGEYKKTELDAWLIYGNDIKNTSDIYILSEGSYYIVIMDWASTSTVDYTFTVN